MLPKWERMRLAEQVGTIRKGPKPQAIITIGVSDYSLTMPPAFHRWARKETRFYVQSLRQQGYTEITVLFHVDDDVPLSRGAVENAAFHAGMPYEEVAAILQSQGFPVMPPAEEPR